MSDQSPLGSFLQLTPEQLATMQANHEKLTKLLDAWDALEKAGVSVPGNKQAIQTVRDLSANLLTQLTPKKE